MTRVVLTGLARLMEKLVRQPDFVTYLPSSVVVVSSANSAPRGRVAEAD